MKNLICTFLLTPILIFSQITGDLSGSESTKTHLGIGLEYANNCEIGILGQYNLNDNISILLKVRRCTHDKKIYLLPGVKYYFNKKVYDILPYIDIRFGKLHYDLSWSSTYANYDYDVVYIYDYSTGQMVPQGVNVTYSASSASGSTIINTRTISLSGGGEYLINNIGLNAALGMSHYTKMEGKFKDKNKFFFTIGVLYYFNK